MDKYLLHTGTVRSYVVFKIGKLTKQLLLATSITGTGATMKKPHYSGDPKPQREYAALAPTLIFNKR
jgi:hypothetical protein